MNNVSGIRCSKVLPEALLYMEEDGKCIIFTTPQHKDAFKGHTVVVSYMDQFEDAIAPYISAKTIAITHECAQYLKDTLQEVNPSIRTEETADEIFFPLRAIKDSEEIAQLEKMAAFTDEAVMFVVKHLKEGMTQYDAEMLLMQYGFAHNIQDFSFPPTAGFKTRGTFAREDNFNFPRTTRLVEGTAIAFDVGYMDSGYCSDWGRTVYFGKAPQAVKDGYKTLQDAQQYMVSKIVPGKTRACDLYRLVEEEVVRQGFGDVLRFRNERMLGHQIGIECHEFPMLSPKYEDVLMPGMVFCSEPKMMFEGECYMRVEDMILIEKTGARFLTNFDRTLFEVF